jgi:hypothetical protein
MNELIILCILLGAFWLMFLAYVVWETIYRKFVLHSKKTISEIWKEID